VVHVVATISATVCFQEMRLRSQSWEKALLTYPSYRKGIALLQYLSGPAGLCPEGSSFRVPGCTPRELNRELCLLIKSTSVQVWIALCHPPTVGRPRANPLEIGQDIGIWLKIEWLEQSYCRQRKHAHEVRHCEFVTR
jgi:hypothetical protein